ncbi:5530_t:CDS:2 [Funneliformis geosporum]|uniref:5530_t:CDS:1 n=1 Tax=Funneliformis geosporum TaxID=1117311 RepID=A0A9W4SAK9_9GLOM|nr:5530_t:CDS:2 [Funneliformis geosporum]
MSIPAGQNFSLARTPEQQIGRDYLKENRNKVKAIIINNTKLLEIGKKWGNKIRILDEKSAQLVSQILSRSPLQKVIENEKNKAEKNKIYLLVGNPENIIRKLDDYLSTLSPEERTDFHFVVGTPPVIGGERKLAKLIDYLYNQGGEITNLSKKEYCRLGVNFYDLKLLLKLLQPIRIITLQNSYKHEKFVPHLSGEFSLIENEEKKLQLKELKIESLALSSLLNLSKLEKNNNLDERSFKAENQKWFKAISREPNFFSDTELLVVYQDILLLQVGNEDHVSFLAKTYKLEYQAICQQLFLAEKNILVVSSQQ